MPMNAGNNDLMHRLSNSFRVSLQTYRRGEDPELFDWFHGLYGQADALLGCASYFADFAYLISIL